MKSKDGGTRGSGSLNRRAPTRISPMPMEWMDPMSWRLPSGKALAEFALQSGFLAPLMLGGPRFKKAKKPAERAPGNQPGANDKRFEATDRLGLDRVATDRLGTDRVAPDRITMDRITTDRMTLDHITLDRVGVDQIGIAQVGIDRALEEPEISGTFRRTR